MIKNKVLVVIDVQNGFLDPSWGPSTNPKCEDNIRALLTHWRKQDWPIVLVRHDSVTPNSTLRPGQSGNDLQPGIDGKHDLLITKSVNSAFYGEPNLENWLRQNDLDQLVICGITTNYCCETTTRMAGNLGFKVEFVLDATRAFDTKDLDGNTIPAADVMRMTAANLNGEFSQIVTTVSLLADTHS
jgi:nicotinamidase-related amidase